MEGAAASPGVVSLSGARLVSVELVRRLRLLLSSSDVTSLDLSGNEMETEMFAECAEALTTTHFGRRPPQLTSLRLNNMRLGVEAVPWLIKIIECPGVAENLEVLSFANWTLNNVVWEPPTSSMTAALKSALSVTGSHPFELFSKLRKCRRLQSLGLQRCNLTPVFLAPLACVLQSQLVEIDLSTNRLGWPSRGSVSKPSPSPEAKRPRPLILARSGSFLETTATIESMGCLMFGPDEEESARTLDELGSSAVRLFPGSVNGQVLSRPACLFAAALISPYCHLQTLVLSACSLTDDIALPIVMAVGNNATINFLDLSHNLLTSRTALEMAAALRKNGTLIELRMGHQAFGFKATQELVEGLKVNSSLAMLCLENTFIETNTSGQSTQELPVFATPSLRLSQHDPPAFCALLRKVADCLEERSTYCRIVLEFPEKARGPPSALFFPGFAPEGEEEDNMGWLRGVGEAKRARRWTLHTSVWKNRVAEADSKDFYDTPAVLGRAFEADWANTKLHRVVRDERDRAAIKPLLKNRYGLLRELFKYYAAQGSNPFGMSFSEFTEMRKGLGLDATGRTAEIDMAFFSSGSAASSVVGTLGKIEGPGSASGLKRGASFTTATNTPRIGAPIGEKKVAKLTSTPQVDKLASLPDPGTSIPSNARDRLPAVDKAESVVLDSTKTGPKTAADAEGLTNNLVRHEMLEAFVRLALAVHKQKRTSTVAPEPMAGNAIGITQGPSESPRSDDDEAMGESNTKAETDSFVVSAVRDAVENHLVPSSVALFGLPPGQMDEAYSNLFRKNRMYNKDVDEVLRRFEIVTRKIFLKYVDESSGFIMLPAWMKLLNRVGVFDGKIHQRATTKHPSVERETNGIGAAKVTSAKTPEFKERDGRLLFLYSIMTVVDEVHRAAKMSRVATHTSLTYVGYLEALCRLADSPACPVSIPAELLASAAVPVPEPVKDGISSDSSPPTANLAPTSESSVGAASTNAQRPKEASLRDSDTMPTTPEPKPGRPKQPKTMVRAGGAMVRRIIKKEIVTAPQSSKKPISRKETKKSAEAPPLPTTKVGPPRLSPRASPRPSSKSARTFELARRSVQVRSIGAAGPTHSEPTAEVLPPTDLPSRLEIMLCHLAVAEGISIRGIERRYTSVQSKP